MNIIFSFIIRSSCIFIQERLTDLYLSSPISGNVQLVSDQGLASNYELLPLAGSTLSYAIKDTETNFVLTYRREDKEVVSTAFNENTINDFSIVLDVYGYVQIKTHDNKYIYYDKDLDKLVAGKFDPKNMMGFRIFDSKGNLAFSLMD